MVDFIETTVRPYFNFWVYVILMMIGLWALIAKNNLIKKLIGLSIFQTAIILFYVSLGVKGGSTIPILDHHGDHHEESSAEAGHHKEEVAEIHVEEGTVPTRPTPLGHAVADASNPDTIANPLPHVLMLTAIVVGVSTLGVALSIAQKIFKEFGSLEENEILEEIKSSSTNG